MHLDPIALGGIYQLDAPLTRDRTVRVEAIDVHHIGPYQRLEQVMCTALVWVRELDGGLRYPVSIQALRPLPHC